MHQTLFVIGPPRTLFDAVPFFVVGAAFVAFGIWRSNSLPTSQAVMLSVFGVLLAWSGWLDTAATQKSTEEFYRAYSEGRCQVAEGLVHLDHVEPAEGHDGIGEFGHVGAEPFQIAHYPAYSQTVADGGVLREGASVRVWLYSGLVLRIDRVPEKGESTPAAPQHQ